MVTGDEVTVRVVIVGGGISGVKAALTLQEKGVSYVLLEAQDRLGGRLRTVEGKNGKYDLGASWFHETLNNALFDEENSIDDRRGPKWFYDDAPIRIVSSDGEVPGSLKLLSIAQEMEKYAEMESHKDLESDTPFYETMVKYLKERKHLLSDEQIVKALEYIRRLELWHGIDTQRLSTKYAAIENEGRDALALNYDRVLKRHVEQLEQEHVKLNCPVSGVERSSSGVVVTTKSGERIKAEYAIVTAPQSILTLSEGSIGYIKFTPPLPARITESLGRVHFGALGKVVLEFDSIFWPTDAERVLALANPPPNFLQSIKNDNPVEPYTSNTTPQTWQYPVLVLNFATTFNKPSLVVLTQSPLTDYLEEHPEEAWDYLKPIISRVSRRESIPSPSNVIVTDWTQNPYQRGSYSACFPGDDPLSAIMALEAGAGRVRFAGEHTILEGAGCVHGAWNSGKREAEYIIDQMTK